MNREYSGEIQANLDRAEESLIAAKELFEKKHYDSCASRVYYAVFYVATKIAETIFRELKRLMT